MCILKVPIQPIASVNRDTNVIIIADLFNAEGHETPVEVKQPCIDKRLIKVGHGFVHNCTELSAGLSYFCKFGIIITTQLFPHKCVYEIKCDQSDELDIHLLLKNFYIFVRWENARMFQFI